MHDLTTRAAAIQGALVGTAIGDALGLPFEGMSRRRIARLLGTARLGHRFVFRRGMVSDDTDHACFVAMSLAEAGDSPTRFARALAWKLRWWLAALPAGIGFGTLRGIVKLWLGVSPDNSGVWSAGNGPAMRAPVIGAYLPQNDALRHAIVAASTRLTHRDPKAEQGARAIADAAATGVRMGPAFNGAEALRAIQSSLNDGELIERIQVVSDQLDRPTTEVLKHWDLQDGVTGYIYDTVPAVLHAWARHDAEAEPAIKELIRCGGDTDTTAAILGGIAGATRGVGSLPRKWIDGIIEWPRSVSWMMRLGEALASGKPAPRYCTWGTWPRNMLFLALVYAQIARRALPPY